MAEYVDPEPVLAECPYCERAVLAREIGALTKPEHTKNWKWAWRYVLARCSECFGPLLLTHDAPWDRLEPLWPNPYGRELSQSIPEPLRREHSEARACLKAKAYTAVAVMVRRTLEGVCADQGVTKRQPLVASLRELHQQGLIEGRLLEWAEALRALGNQGAHYTGVQVSREDATDALALAEALLDYMYVFASQYEQFKTRRSKPEASPAPEDAGRGEASGIQQ
ncbi:DUF4145 domain-containing protein [Streptomyces sp. NPDC049954]|uniref:DUF4145 domain-containing protein n=1 Tax=Streptomyces sp. NPDC049954 TaxID=3155779 RepID=UPI00343DB772